MAQHECPHCGVVLTKHRSSPDHRRFFALVAAAFAQWPENNEYQPENEEKLRAWLICKAGARWRISTPIFLPDDATEHMRVLFRLGIEAAIRAAKGEAFVTPYKDSVAVHTPKSIAFHEMDQREFGALRAAVEDVIKAETGLDPEQLLRERAA
jgi:hypothetical protein